MDFCKQNFIHPRAKFIDNDVVYTEKELINLMNNLAANILVKMNSEGMRKDVLAGVYLDRGIFTYISVFSIFKLGLTYVPLDTAYPENRLEYILSDSNCDIIITNKKYAAKFEAPKIIIEELDEGLLSNTRDDKNNVACVLYTSGTTGKPKGVALPYRAIETFLEDIGERIAFSSDMTTVSFTKPTFDMFINDSILAAFYGITVVIEEDDLLSYRKAFKHIEKYNVNMYTLTPSRLQLLIDISGDYDFLSQVRHLLLGGERVPINLLGHLQQYKCIRVHNMYGPTETTACVTTADLTNSDSIHAGKALKNSEVMIDYFNSEKKNGEIFISGAGLAIEYLNNPELTQEKFVFINGKRYYRTGDVGSFDVDGNLLVEGRIDSQIKHNGYRIELDEIEKVAENLPGIKLAIAFISARNQLVLLCLSDSSFLKADISKHLINNLPQYMIPNKIGSINDFSINLNGKIERTKIIDIYNRKNQ